MINCTRIALAAALLPLFFLTISSGCKKDAPKVVEPERNLVTMQADPMIITDPLVGVGDPCQYNEDCRPGWLVCHTNTEGDRPAVCVHPDTSEMIGHGNLCTMHKDCFSSVWGHFCKTAQNSGLDHGFCQECIQKDTNNDGVEEGCTPSKPRCGWGIFGGAGDPNRSYYYCTTALAAD